MAYATRADLARLGAGGAALVSFTGEEQDAALAAASGQAEGFLGQRYTLPLLTWGDDLRRAVCNIAAYDLHSNKGYNPSAGADVNIRLRYEDAMKWLKQVSDGAVTPAIADSSASTGSARPSVVVRSAARRGW